MNYLRTLLWIVFAMALAHAIDTYAVQQKGKGTVEQDGAGGAPGQHRATQTSRDAVPSLVDVDAAYEAILRKHVAKHQGEITRLDLELQRLERHMKIVNELQADQQARFEMGRKP